MCIFMISKIYTLNAYRSCWKVHVYPFFQISAILIPFPLYARTSPVREKQPSLRNEHSILSHTQKSIAHTTHTHKYTFSCRLFRESSQVRLHGLEIKWDEITRGQFSKITEIACLLGWEFGADNSPHGVYVTRHWNWMNSFWTWSSLGEQFLRFSKNDLSWSNRIFSFLKRENLVFFWYSY